jgi:hypothetical protein
LLRPEEVEHHGNDDNRPDDVDQVPLGHDRLSLGLTKRAWREEFSIN